MHGQKNIKSLPQIDLLSSYCNEYWYHEKLTMFLHCNTVYLLVVASRSREVHLFLLSDESFIYSDVKADLG
jgi:hypothetical protein